jgi:hypothetical protein
MGMDGLVMIEDGAIVAARQTTWARGQPVGDSMAETRCAFHTILRAGQAHCSLAEHVTRREGPDVDCRSPEAQARCAALLVRLKAVALPAFGVEDDPLAMPQAVMMKVQLGGLTGLQAMMGEGGEAVADVDGLVTTAAVRFGGVDGVPVQELVDAITSFKLKRRRG